MERSRRRASESITEEIYAAAMRPADWSRVVESMAKAFDAAVLIVINLPGSIPRQFFSSGIEPGFPDRYAECLFSGLPFTSKSVEVFVPGFRRFSDAFEGIELGESEFFKSWMKPQGFAPEWPVAHSLTLIDDSSAGVVSLFRRDGGEPFSKSDLELGDTLVSHLSRAINFYFTLEGVQRERLALAEVIDRLPMGVILIDAERQPVICNRSAEQITQLDDGFRLGENGPVATDARENATLQKLLADALECEPGRELHSSGFMSVTRRKGKRSFPMMVTPLMAAPPGGRSQEAVVAIFVSNSEAAETGPVSAAESLRRLYDLTAAEAQIVERLADGNSLEAAAAARGVSIHTARSHLKRAFAKTDTQRQGELVRLVLTGVTSIREH
jgi:DNA-binding CsgD family transcriptional regulator